MNRSAGELVARLKVTPRENDVSRSLEAQAAEMRETLKTKSGAEFDRAYIDGQVAGHQSTLNFLQAAQNQVQNADLRQTITSAIPDVQKHLDRAKELQAKIGQ